MKREILFRGARVCDGNLVNGALVMVKENDESEKYIPNIVISYGHNTFDWFEVDPETVGQFTGMTDKNGKRIFEGDIVNHTRRTSNGIESANAEVYFDTEMLEFGLKYLNELFHCNFNNEFEVIGNIHDNK